MTFEKICVIGLGYIGLPTASTFASHGLHVVGVDVNQTIVDGLQKGELHIYEPGLRTLVQAALKSGNLTINKEPEPADAFIIAVPTPFYGDKLADMRFVISATEAIVPHLRKGNLVILESTSPPRTTTNIVAPILERTGLKAGKDFHLAYSPERVLPGQILRELIENARVLGGIDRKSAEAGRDLYSIFVKGEIYLTDATTAEMVKLMENTYRDVNIAISNEFSRLADRFGVNVWDAITLANKHPRVRILNPGIGVGGHCISVDPWFFVEAAPDLARLIRTAREVNDSQPEFVVASIKKAIDGVKGKNIAVLGLAYKADVDDLRESPALDIARLLVESGAIVSAFEPFKTDFNLEGVRMGKTLEETIRPAQAIVLLVGHRSLCEIDPVAIKKISAARVAFDAVNGWPKEKWEKTGFQYSRLSSFG